MTVRRRLGEEGVGGGSAVRSNKGSIKRNFKTSGEHSHMYLSARDVGCE